MCDYSQATTRKKEAGVQLLVHVSVKRNRQELSEKPCCTVVVNKKNNAGISRWYINAMQAWWILYILRSICSNRSREHMRPVGMQ